MRLYIKVAWATAAVVASVAFLLWSVKSEGSQFNCKERHTLATITANFANEAATARAHDGDLVIAQNYRKQADKATEIANKPC